MTRIWRDFDWIILGLILFLGAASLVSLSSSDTTFFWRQLVWYALSILVIAFGSRLDWRWLISQNWFRYGLYISSVLFLVISNLQSRTIRGTKSWITFGSFQFEPAELAKIALIILLAGFFSRRYLEAWRGKNIFISLMLALLPAILVAIHPDLGSALVIMSIWFGFLLMSGVNYRRLAVGLILGILIFSLLWVFYLKPYQKDRLTGFLFQEKDPLGINYNVIQSKIAIGSAGFFGKGFGAGTQTQLKFLPETQTDFIFAAFVEEWGILGGGLIVLAFIFLLYRIVLIGLTARSNGAKFISLGAGLMFLVHFGINLGSNLGLLPVAGIPFPFLSYGGSSLLTDAVLISIIEHIKLESR